MKRSNLYIKLMMLFIFFFFCLQRSYPQAINRNTPSASAISEAETSQEESLAQIIKALSGEYEYSELPQIYSSFSVCLKSLRLFINVKLLLLSEKERERYAIDISDLLRSIQAFSILESNNYPPLAEIAYDCALLNKGFLLSLSNYVETAKRNINDPQLKELWMQIDEIKQFAGKLRGYFETLKIKDTYEYTKNKAIQENDSSTLSLLQEYVVLEDSLAVLEHIIAEKEEEFVLSVQKNLPRRKDLHLDWKHIRTLLNTDEAAVEFALCPKEPDYSSDEYYYYALVLRCNDPYPQIVRLDSEDNLSPNGKQPAIQSYNFDNTYTMVWKHIEKYLESINNVYISPIGILNSISYAQVKNEKEKYITDTYTIHHVISTRDILRLKNVEHIPYRDAVLLGGVEYGRPGLVVKNGKPSKLKASDSNQNILLDNTRGQGADYLPESQKEIMDIFRLIGNWLSVTCYYGEDVTKKRLFFYSNRSPYVLHISTHGFYFPKNKSEYNKTMSVESNLFRVSNNPLMRCGLLFSGANHIWEGNEPLDNIENGILTAYEISKLNLSATRLVVLSACSTGLGDVDYNEGVYGLQRAFRLAGATSMIVSLRKVPDKETKELMILFYKNFTSGIKMKEAFDNAQKEMRRKYPENPKKWAGFILIE